jgi:pSer/pThr/pTyr-binding forkhead associated (FHA) protein
VAVPLTLKVFKGEQLVATKEYDRDIIKIGRLSSAHLCLEDDKVSRIHSVIEVAPDGSLSIIDMGSVEGTYVNGKRVNKGTLAFGDEIKVGNTTIKVDKNDGASVAPSIAPVAGVEAATNPAAPVVESNSPTVQIPAQSAPEPVAAAAAAPEPTQVVAAAVAAPEPVVAAPPPPPPPAYEAPAPAPAPRAADPEATVIKSEATGDQVRAPPRRRKGSGPLGVEVRFMWGDQMLESYFLHPEETRAIKVGSGLGVNFAMGDSKLGGPIFEVVRFDKGNATVRFTNRMKGELHRRQGDEVMTVKDAIDKRVASSDCDGYAVSLAGDDFIWIDLGGVVVEIFFQPVPKAVFVPLSETIDYTALNIFLVMFFLGAMFVISALTADMEGDEFADDLNANNARIAKLIIKPPEVEKKLKAFSDQKKQSGEMAEKHKKDEGQMGKKDAPKKSAHAAPKGDPNNKDQARLLMQKVFGASGGGISTIFGHQGLGGELKSAMGNMFGAAPGDAQGFGGLGLRGSGSGGGGLGDTIGIGGIGTKGRGGGTGGYGSGVGVLGGKQNVDIGITSSEPTVMGSLDKELIRQVIKRNVNQIRYCYESQLTRYPKLNGKVSVKFVISASGSVASSNVASADTNNAELETCVAGRVRTWMFPKPKGGGVVIVTYPFIFKKSGE